MQILNIFTSFSSQFSLTIFLVKSKFLTAEKSKTTTISRVFHPKKSTILSGNQSWIFFILHVKLSQVLEDYLSIFGRSGQVSTLISSCLERCLEACPQVLEQADQVDQGEEHMGRSRQVPISMSSPLQGSEMHNLERCLVA